MYKVLITGASGGIGNEISKYFSNDNAFAVTNLGKNECDLSKPKNVQSFLDKSANEEFDIVVLAAAINFPKSLSETDYNLFNETLETNVLGHKSIIDFFLPRMTKNNFGRIIAISSLYSQKTRPGRWPYSASKAVLDTLIRSIALEYSQFNILANCVVPGFVDTPLTRRNNSSEEIQKLIDRIPLGRLATPLEIAKLAFFLASPDNTYITGQSIVIDGGFSIQ